MRSKRLSISTFVAENWKAYHEIQTSEAHHRYNSETFSPKPESENRQYVESLITSPYLPEDSRYVFAIHARSDGDLVGVIGLKLKKLIFTYLKLFILYGNLKCSFNDKHIFIYIAFMRFS